MKKATLALLGLVLLAPAAANAQTVDEPAIAANTSDTRVKFWSVDTGVRNTWVRDAAYDPYSRNNALTQWSIGLARTTFLKGNLSFAPGFRWDVGSSHATARGADTSFVAHRLTIPLELRLHAERWLYVFTRVAPGGVWQRSKVADSSLGEALIDSGWAPAGDVSVGASLLAINTTSSPTSHAPRFWITPELGYAWAGRSSAALSPKVDENDPRQFGTLSMTGVALRGMFLRVNLTATF